MAALRDPEGENYRKFEDVAEPVILFLSLMFVPIFLGPLLADLSDAATRAFLVAGAAIWVVLVVEYLVLLYLAPDRKQMIKTHKLDLVIVLVPFLRPLAFLHIVRLAAAASGLGRAIRTMRNVAIRQGMRGFLVVTTGAILAGAALTLAFEHEQPGSSIADYGDALWWAFVTCTTVGYGDVTPVTGGGQIVATFLMVIGIAGLGLLTASIAAEFVVEDEEAEVEETGVDLVALKHQLDRIEESLRHQQAT